MEATPVVKMQHSQSLAELGKALAAAQKTIQPAIKDTQGQVGNQKRMYADIQSVWQACRASLTEHGLSVVQVPSAAGPAVTVTTLLLHSSGEWISGELTMQATKNDPQSIGSVITYARRYALSAMVSVAPGDDDDGNAGTHRDEPDTLASREASPPEAPPRKPPEPKPWDTPDGAALVKVFQTCQCAKAPSTDALDLCRYTASLAEWPLPKSMADVWPKAGEYCTAITDRILAIHDSRQCSPDDAAVILRDEARQDAAARNEG